MSGCRNCQLGLNNCVKIYKNQMVALIQRHRSGRRTEALCRRRVAARAALVLAAALPILAVAQTYPSKPIRVIQTLGAGGGADPLARLIGLFIDGWCGCSSLDSGRWARGIETELRGW